MNFLVKAVDGLTFPAPTMRASSKSELLHVNSIHKTWIYNQSQKLKFQGYVPADFQITLQSEWGPLFPTMSASELAGQAFNSDLGRIETIAKAAGASTKTRFLSAQAWQGPAYLQLSLPIQINAYVDTKKEVIDKLVQVSKFATPTVADTGMMVAPGPAPLAAIGVEAASLLSLNGLQAQLSKIDEDQMIYVQIGRFFRMTPCIVTNVTAAFSGQPEDVTGNPMGIDLNLELSSYYAVTHEDLLKWFAGGFGNPTGDEE